MLHIAKRTLAMCLSLLVLMMTTASAEVPFLVHCNGWAWESPVEVLLKADVATHMPYDDDRLAMLTPITDMLSLRLMKGQNEGSITVAIDGADALTLQYRGNEAQLSSLPDTTYQAQGDLLSMLLGADLTNINVNEMLGLAPEGESLLEDGQDLLAEIPAAFEAFGKRTESVTAITGIGKSAYRYDYTVAADQAEVVKSTLLQICNEGWLREIITSLTFSGKQTLRIYYNADGVLMRAEYNGGCGMAEDLRTVNLVYKFRNDDVKEMELIELTSPAKRGRDKNTLTFERITETNKKGQRVYNDSYVYTVVKDGVTSIWKGDVALTNAFTEDADVISGEVYIRSKLNDDKWYDSLMLTTNLTISGTDDMPVVTGTVDVQEKQNGKFTEDALVSVELKPAEALLWADSANKVDLSKLSVEALAAVQQEVAASVATSLVRPLILKMGADAEWFFRDLPADAVQSILEAAGAAN